MEYTFTECTYVTFTHIANLLTGCEHYAMNLHALAYLCDEREHFAEHSSTTTLSTTVPYGTTA